ncbi:MAG TPA: hypothetical protein PLE99_10960 [Candidatus Thiothrix moscowensis]|uniref:hypothetical protein n=1 Tax=unclassified Thiothrix TaxID=2636184 RepID=UPI0025D22495|nr:MULTISPECIES: hypothetical protein [unclassified Thiothrix]HRJ53280.1 hypothetical protein [Candidatus Thiothrix moscowensis]HRJ93150.1 hypothetical protein [Candidatus Thiothrix moscowensis]
MDRKGLRNSLCVFFVLLLWLVPAAADETVEEITSMMEWWDEYGSYWDEAEGLIEFASDEPIYLLADNTVETSE